MASCSRATFSDLPLELLSNVSAAVFWSAQHPPLHTLDPFVPGEHGLDSPGSQCWSEPVMRGTLASLCRVNHACAEAARPWLWRVVQVRLPRDWLALLDQTLEEEVEEDIVGNPSLAGSETTASLCSETGVMSVRSSLSSSSSSSWVPAASSAAPTPVNEFPPMPSVSFADAPGMSIPPELLSPAPSREPSRARRLRSKSRGPARWEVIRQLTHAMETMMHRSEPAYFVPAPPDERWGRFVTRLDFNHFRTINMRRSVEDGVKHRFVTGDRLEALLKEMPHLISFGATEYMDSALTLGVLKELLLRGSPSAPRGRGRRVIVDEDERDRLREFGELEAIDFTGCVSATFVSALTSFVDTYLQSTDSDSIELPGLRRISLRGVKSITAPTLEKLIGACPSLTHLDISCTRVSPSLLERLGQSTSLHLTSLSLERCPQLTGDSIVDFLLNAPAARTLRELNLHADAKVPSPLSHFDMQALLQAPCIADGTLVYFDLSGAPLTPSTLASFPPQPALRSLGLSYLPTLSLGAIRDFIRDKASNVEVLAITGTSPELGYAPLPVPGVGAGTRRATLSQATLALHSQLISPLSNVPVRWSISGTTYADPPTRLRVVELAGPVLGALQRGSSGWRVVRSKGGRGWYVDSASGWVSGVSDAEPGASGVAGVRVAVLKRNLDEEHPRRQAIDRLADANGNVSSSVGWHSRKMEIIQGDGMLGREEGLYGAVAFAYQG